MSMMKACGRMCQTKFNKCLIMSFENGYRFGVASTSSYESSVRDLLTVCVLYISVLILWYQVFDIVQKTFDIKSNKYENNLRCTLHEVQSLNCWKAHGLLNFIDKVVGRSKVKGIRAAQTHLRSKL